MGRTRVVVRLTSVFCLLSLSPAWAGGYDRCLEVRTPTTITTDQRCVRVTKKVTGDVVNNAAVGRSDSERPGFFIGDGRGLLTGALVNNGVIRGGGGGLGALTLGRNADVQGGIRNNGTIVSTAGNAINLGYSDDDGDDHHDDDHHHHHGEWSLAQAVALTGNITNAGLIDGRLDGIAALYGTMSGRLINAATGTIKGGDNAIFIADSFAAWTGGIENQGLIEGGKTGIVIDGVLFKGGLLNAAGATIKGRNGDGIAADAEWWGDFDNRGTIAGTRDGFAYDGSVFRGNVANTGLIQGGRHGISLAAVLFEGAFSNGGTIDGGATGVMINVGQWGTAVRPVDITNAAGASITGGQTGLSLTAGTVNGDLKNAGKITGASGGGLAIAATTYNGDIENAGEITASSNAMRVTIATLNGQVANSGKIKATASNGTAVNLAVGNGTTFTNEGGGLIFGDVLMNGPGAYTFRARDGGLEGDLVGQGAGEPLTLNDRLIVEGTHHFVEGEIRNFLSFDVNDGGVAIMGARFIGDATGQGYDGANLGALGIRDGGRLYLDDDTVLSVRTFTQEEGGELTLYLVAPEGTPVAGQDYGRIDASGAVQLGGKLSVVLDPASFGGTTKTDFVYADIIKGASFTGEFDETAVEGSTYFFKLALTYGATSVNLNVTRTPFDQTFCAQHLSENSANLGAAIEAAFRAGGFTPQQIELFNFLGQLRDVCSAYFDLGGAILGDINAITVETAGPWKSAVNDRVNASGATSCIVAGLGDCLTRYAANGATAVQSDAEDPFAWLDTGVRPEGQFSVWGRILGVQGDNHASGGAIGSDFTVTGLIGGADYVITNRFIAGVAVQWTTTDVDFKHRSDTADIQSFEVGGYFSYGDVEFCINGNASIIFHDFDTYRFPFGAAAQASYEGRTISAYLEAGKVFELDRVRIEPVAAVSFAALDTDPYAETGTAGGNLLIVQGASHQSLKSIAGARFAYVFHLDSGRKIVPEGRLFWAHEFLDDRSEFEAALTSLPNNPFRVFGQRYARDSLLAGVGLNVPLSPWAAVYVDYDASLSPDQTVQAVSLGARLSW